MKKETTKQQNYTIHFSGERVVKANTLQEAIDKFTAFRPGVVKPTVDEVTTAQDNFAKLTEEEKRDWSKVANGNVELNQNRNFYCPNPECDCDDLDLNPGSEGMPCPECNTPVRPRITAH
jgi:hypothetical protein